MVAALTLWEIAVHDRHRHAIGVSERAPDEAALGVFFVSRETFVDSNRLLTREHCHAVVAFLAMEIHVVAKGAYFFQRKLIVVDLGFLQADHVRLVFFDQRCQLMRTGAQSVDVEGNNLHGRQSWQKGDAS